VSDPVGFAARLLRRRGALVEAGPARVEAVLPPELAAELGIPEHVVLASAREGGTHVIAYGSALLERMVASATSAVPWASVRAKVAVARESQARAAVEALVFRNGVFDIGVFRADTGRRLIAHAAFTLHGDERREGLCAAAASLGSGTEVVGFEEAVAGALEEEDSTTPRRALFAGARTALTACATKAAEATTAFREGMQRRFARDQERLEAYFGQLVAELDRREKRLHGGALDLEEKRRVLKRERTAKLEALSARYVVRLELRLVAALVVEAPVLCVPLELRRRKATRTIEVEFDCATRRLVALPCDACDAPAPRPAACDDAFHLLCETCAPRSEGRVVCPACRPKRDAAPGPGQDRSSPVGQVA